MNQRMEHITASCVVENGAVYRNGALIFTAGAADAGAPGLGVDSPALAAPALAAPGFAAPGFAVPGFAAAAPAEFLSAVYRHFDWQYPKFYKMDPLSRLGWITTELLLGPGWDTTIYRPEDIAIVLSNAHSSLDTDYRYNDTIRDIPSPSVFVYTLPNIMIGEISIRHGIKGESAFFLSASFDPILLADYTRLLLQQGIAGAAIVGWVDLLGDDYKAALFLIEKMGGPDRSECLPETMQAIFQNLSKPWM